LCGGGFRACPLHFRRENKTMAIITQEAIAKLKEDIKEEIIS